MDDLDFEALLENTSPEDSPPPEELAKPAQPAKPAPPPPSEDDVEAMLGDFIGESSILKTESELERVDLTKPWMKYHKFVLVQTVEGVRDIVDQALAHGAVALDLETQGLDNRIDYDSKNQPHTRHKIVGYCFSIKGVGYYVPVRHVYASDMGERNPNADPAGVEAEIKRLCLASQPELTEEGKAQDPLGSPKIAVPPKVVIYFWNAKFDQEFLYPITGIDFWHPESFEDGNLAAYCLYSDDKSLSLKAKAKQRLRLFPDESDQFHEYEMIRIQDLFPTGTKRKDIHFAELYPEEGSAVLMYGCSDGICTELLCEAMKDMEWEYAEDARPVRVEYKNVVGPAKAKRFSFTYRLERQTAQAVRLMERTRTLINKDEIGGLMDEANAELVAMDEELIAQAELKGFKGFNPGSADQLGEFLFSERGLDIDPKPEKTATGQYKTDAQTLEKIADKTDLDIIRQFLKRRQIVKIKGTYLEGMANNTDEDNRLRFQFKQTGAATGRFSAPKGEASHGFAGIPIHGIPARDDPKKPKVAQSLRRLFVSSPGYTFVKVDYAGQELRIVANLSGEPLWTKEFLEGSGDLHTLTAQAFFGAHITKKDKLERNMAKIANFSMIYGGGVQAIMRATKCDKVEAARKKAAFDQSVPVFAQWVKRQHASVKKNLGVVNGFGRFIAIPDAKIGVGGQDANGKTIIDGGDVRRIRAGCERKSTNYPVQGSGADILKISLVKLAKELTKRGWLRNGGDDSVRILMTVHDEIDFEIRHDRLQEAVPIIGYIMESPSTLARWKIPLIVEPEIALSWAAKHDFNAIMRGDDPENHPVPEWLEGILTPGAPPPDMPAAAAPVAAKPAAATAAPAFPATKPATVAGKAPAQPNSSSEPATKGNGVQEVATFSVPNSYLTREAIRLVQKAIIGAGPVGPERGEPRFKRLRLLDQNGGTLIGIELRIFVDPDLFARELRERNLGQGGYTVLKDLSMGSH